MEVRANMVLKKKNLHVKNKKQLLKDHDKQFKSQGIMAMQRGLFSGPVHTQFVQAMIRQ